MFVILETTDKQGIILIKTTHADIVFAFAEYDLCYDLWHIEQTYQVFSADYFLNWLIIVCSIHARKKVKTAQPIERRQLMSLNW